MNRARRNAHPCHGFTLIELLVVLFMLSVMITVAAPSFVKLHEDSSLRSAARVVLSMFQYARSMAVTRHTEVRLVFSNDRRSFELETRRQTESSGIQFVPERTSMGRRRTMPNGISTSVTRGASQQDEHLISFHPNGSTDDAVVTLTNTSGRKLYVVCQSVTGRVSIETDSDRISQMFTVMGR